MKERLNLNKKPKIETETPFEKLDKILEHMLLESKELGAGKDGIVFKIDLSALPQDERHLLAEDKVISPNEEVDAMAAKILKIYNPLLGDYEFRMQKKAREIIAREKNVAQIPDTTTARDQEIGEKTRNRLNIRGANLSDRAEIIIMDYIDGEDLGTIMYKFVLKNLGYEEEYIADLTYGQKEQIVGEKLGFEIADTEKAESHEEKKSIQALAFDRNEEKLFKYLKKEGFKFDPSVFEKIENTMRTLNQNGIYHNDLHKQNVMIDKNGEVYVIDFGRAGSEKRKDGIGDMLLSTKWKGLSISAEEEKKMLADQELAQINNLQERMLANSAQRERFNLFVKNIIEKGIQELEKEFALSKGDDSKFEQFLIMLHLAREHVDTDKKVIEDFITSLENKNLRPFEKNRILKLKQLGYL
jgi:serine/threonine protein kinase